MYTRTQILLSTVKSFGVRQLAPVSNAWGKPHILYIVLMHGRDYEAIQIDALCYIISFYFISFMYFYIFIFLFIFLFYFFTLYCPRKKIHNLYAMKRRWSIWKILMRWVFKFTSAQQELDVWVRPWICLGFPHHCCQNLHRPLAHTPANLQLNAEQILLTVVSLVLVATAVNTFEADNIGPLFAFSSKKNLFTLLITALAWLWR